MKIIIYKKLDGTISMSQISYRDGSLSWGITNRINDGMSEKESLEFEAHKAMKKMENGTTFRIGNTTDFPGGSADGLFDCTFFNAFTDDHPGAQVDIDIPRAKDVAHTIRRNDRAEKMEPLDRYASVPAMFTEIEAERQVVRDSNAAVQIGIDAANTVELLKDQINTLRS